MQTNIQPFNQSMTAEVLTITPSHAQQMLRLNKQNRPVSKSTVKNYSDKMKRGEWLLTGEPLIFSNTGLLLNGQHRLTAVILSGISIEALVVYGADPAVFIALDQGKTRCTGDVFAIEGEKDYNKLAAACRTAFTIQQAEASDNKVRSVFSLVPSTAQLQDYLDRNREIRHWVSRSSKLTGMVESGLISGLLYLFSLSNKEAAEVFADRLIDGAGLPVKHPILVLREKLLVNRASTRRLPRLDTAAIIIKTWNAFVSNKELRICKWAEYEAFPTIL